MSIGAVSSNNQYAAGMPSGMSQVRQDFQSLQNSLASGDLAGAQNAFATVQQDFQNLRQQNGGTLPISGNKPGTTRLAIAPERAVVRRY